jgi:hydroxymethylpyrimidine kinase/phosphomethylpyrimidine kinase
VIGPRVLVAGGVDPTGRAGIARDVAALESERVEPALVVTAITVQDVHGVRDVQPVALDLVQRSLDAAASLGDLAAIKIGLVPTPELADALSRFARKASVPVVVDPVLRASTGEPLTRSKPTDFLTPLLRTATVATPNLDELAAFQGVCSTIEARIRAAQQLRTNGGPRAVLVKGGHAPDTPVMDLLVTDDVEHMAFPRLELPPPFGRGKGCELASRIAALLSKGLDVRDAVRVARQAAGPSIVRHAARTYNAALERLMAQLEPRCVPEVGMNLAYAPRGIDDPTRVLGLAGRVTIAGASFAVTGRPTPGGPHHTGRIAATAQRLTRGPVWVFNHRHHASLLPEEGEDHFVFRREDEPASVDSSMEWMTETAIRRLGRLPAYVSDSGMSGKEAMIRIFGSTPDELLARHQALHHPRGFRQDVFPVRLMQPTT